MARTIPYDPRHVAPAVEVILPSWHENAELIGITPEEADEVQALLDEAKAKMFAADEARIAARNATIDFHTAAEALQHLASATVRRIRAYAELTANPQVYALAAITPPKKPARQLPPPGTPVVRTLRLEYGRVEVRWTAKHPAGMANVVYHVSREITCAAQPSSPTTEQLGTTGERTYLDHSLPPGVLAVRYLIIALHGGRPSAPGSSPLLQLVGNRARAGSIPAAEARSQRAA